MTTAIDCPSFIDLRAFAADAAADIGPDPFGDDRCLLPLRENSVEAGSIHVAAGTGTVTAATGDCWMILADGAITLSIDGQAREHKAGDSWVVAAGTAFDWAAAAPATIIFLRYLAGSDSPTGIVPIDTDAQLAPSGSPLADLLIGDTPSCRNFNSFRSVDGVFTCGVWDSTPYHRLPMRYGHFELMYLLQGQVTFVDEIGRSRTFAQDDIFLVERGASCSWESREHVAKVFAIYRPLA